MSPDGDTPKVTRADLRHFDGEATRLILWAQEQGARIRISRKGHALVYGPKGGSASISQKTRGRNRSSHNTKSEVSRLFKKGSN